MIVCKMDQKQAHTLSGNHNSNCWMKLGKWMDEWRGLFKKSTSSSTFEADAVAVAIRR